MSPIAIALAVLASAAAPQPGAAPARSAPAPEAAGATPSAAPGVPVRRTVEGRVTYATATTAFLDAGTLEGLAPGMEVRLGRAGAPAVTCRIQEVGDHTASCAGTGIRAGQSFAFETAIAAAPAAVQLPAIPADDEQARRLAAVQVAAAPLVEAQAKARDVYLPQLPVLHGDLGYAVWVTSAGGSGYQRLQLDVGVNGLELFEGIKLYADARVMQWTQQGPAILGGSTQLLVYDLEIAQRDPALRWTAALGRVQPWFVPGATAMDGAQAGARIGAVEVGAFGGLLPNPYTTEPRTDSWTGGLYARLEQPFGKTLLVGGLRGAAVQEPALGRHYEGQLSLQFWAGSAFGASAEIQAGGGDLQAPGAIDFGRIHLTSRPIAPLFLGAGFSYWGLWVPDAAIVASWPGPSRRADATVGGDVASWMTLAAFGGFVDDLVTFVSHRYVGPEVAFPKVLDGLMFAYQKDLGWVEGQAAWGQVSWRPGPGTRLFGRLSWNQAATGTGQSNDLGLTVSGTVALERWLALRFSAMLRSGLDEASVPFGTASQVFLVATY